MKDRFSSQADIYSAYRPGYPPALFQFILQQVAEKGTAWDCATGNGQAAKELAPHFKQLFATDHSQKQLDHAHQLPNIIYSLQPADQTNFSDQTFDLITIAQALHWFCNNNFYKEVKRVAKPGAIIAAWSYSLVRISTTIDLLLDHYHYHTMAPYWDAERKYVDEEYRTIPFPFREIEAPGFAMEYQWTLDILKGYLNTWSALQKFIQTNDFNPVDSLINEIRPHWTNEKMKVVFPLHMRMGVVD
jgi:SAM-dependent methyltransferase